MPAATGGTNDTPHQAARRLAELGYKVLPIIPGKKHPGLADWVNHATSDPATIDAWYGGLYANHGVGIATGHDGLFVVDVDVADGKPGDATLEQLEDQHGWLPGSVVQRTGSGGRHILLRAPDGVEIRNSAGNRLGPGLDVRGIGGQIVVAPTVHPCGEPYEWVVAPWDAPVAAAPAWLVDLLTRDDPPMRDGGSSPAIADGPGSGPGFASRDDASSPGTWFNDHTTWAELLEGDGWTRDHRNGRDGEQRWVRPGKSLRDGISATVGHGGGQGLHVFTSSVPELDADGNYTRFGYYAATRHGGDHSAAARAIRRDRMPREYVGTWAPPAGATGPQGPQEGVEGDGALVGIDLLELLAEPEESYDWLIPGLIEVGDRLILTGYEGKGKSTALRQLAVACATGVHPFTFEPLPRPLQVLSVDCENSKRQVRRKLAMFAEVIGDYADRRLIFEFRPEGLDLTMLNDRAWLDDLIGATRPDLVIIGPLYKLASGNPKDEEQARAVAYAIDDLRVRYGCAFAIEAHVPYSDGGAQSKRPERPYGASLWSRWPEFGLFLDPEGALRPWRGGRDEREFPSKLERSTPWPWAPAPSSEKPWEGPRHCMEAVIRVLDGEPNGLSQRGLIAAMSAAGEGFKANTVRIAAEKCVQEGLIVGRTGARNARIYSPIDDRVPPRPTASRTRSEEWDLTASDRVPGGGTTYPPGGGRGRFPSEAQTDAAWDAVDRDAVDDDDHDGGIF